MYDYYDCYEARELFNTPVMEYGFDEDGDAYQEMYILSMYSDWDWRLEGRKVNENELERRFGIDQAAKAILTLDQFKQELNEESDYARNQAFVRQEVWAMKARSA